MYDFTQGRLIPKPTTGVDLYTASWVIHTRNGDLNFAEAGVIDFGTGNLLAL
jgi:hypothetical protein